jgi:transcriptional regulator
MVIYDKKAAQNIELSYQTPEIVRQRIQTIEALALRAGEQVLDAEHDWLARSNCWRRLES